jgi:beta-N-acetylhexosaminidase
MKRQHPVCNDIYGLFVTGFDGYDLPDDTASLLARGLAGVTLFKRNIKDSAQVATLCRDIRSAAAPTGLVPIIAVDQEGGRVQRLRDIITLVPPMRQVAAGGMDGVRQAGISTGHDLASLGFNLDFAPVLDVDSNPGNPIIGDRSFSSDPEVVSRCAVAFYEGLLSAGVAGCGKHFPGHGDASADSHLELPEINVNRKTIESRELLPFAAAVASGFGMIMTAHCLYPSVDPLLPATLSPQFIRPYLRDRLGFEGVVITDDLGMKAISDRFSPAQVITLGLEAGVDIFLHCGISGESQGLMQVFEDIVNSGVVGLDRIRESSGRIKSFQANLR